MSQSRTVSAYVALLRGVNLGGKNRLPMPELAKMFVEAGCTEVRTYIQSGNVVFRATPAKAEKLPVLIPRRIAEDFRYQVPVVVRSSAELAELIQSNPFLQAGIGTETLHVLFLSTRPGPEQIAKLDPERSAPDVFIVHGQEIYLHLPNGVADTKLTNAYFDSKLSTMCTGRNWRTTIKLLEMMEA